MKSIFIFVLFLALPLLAGKISALMAGDIAGSYAMLNQPPFSPPGEVFPLVWGVLFLLMGISSWLVYRKALAQKQSPQYYLRPYAVQLILNICWSPLFFGLQAYWAGAVLALLLLIVVVAMIVRFNQISRPAAWLQVPYLLWSAFAVYISFGVAVLSL